MTQNQLLSKLVEGSSWKFGNEEQSHKVLVKVKSCEHQQVKHYSEEVVKVR